jgi:erythritol kinase
MASTLNLDWVLALASQVASSLNMNVEKDQLLNLINGWIKDAPPASLLYHPYISDAGERGPFIDHTARASFVGLNSNQGFGDLVRGTIEGLGFAARDCYAAIGQVPSEIRLTGGAAQSHSICNARCSRAAILARGSRGRWGCDGRSCFGGCLR